MCRKLFRRTRQKLGSLAVHKEVVVLKNSCWVFSVYLLMLKQHIQNLWFNIVYKYWILLYAYLKVYYKRHVPWKYLLLMLPRETMMKKLLRKNWAWGALGYVTKRQTGVNSKCRQISMADGKETCRVHSFTKTLCILRSGTYRSYHSWAPPDILVTFPSLSFLWVLILNHPSRKLRGRNTSPGLAGVQVCPQSQSLCWLLWTLQIKWFFLMFLLKNSNKWN